MAGIVIFIILIFCFYRSRYSLSDNEIDDFSLRTVSLYNYIEHNRKQGVKEREN